MDVSPGQDGIAFGFTGIASFLRAQICQDVNQLDADIAIVGAPIDEGSPFLPGSRFGPRSIREHSMRFVTDPPGIYDPQSRLRILEREMAGNRLADCGDATILPTNVAGCFSNITDLVAGVLREDALPVVVGGDHAITFPAVRAFADHGPLHIVHFDAHLDYMPFIHGMEYTNQHAFRHIRRMDNVRTLTQAGIRSLRGSQDHARGLPARRQPGRDHERLPARSSGEPDRRHPGRRLLLREHRHRRARPAAGPRLRLGRARRHDLSQLRDSLRVLAEHTQIVGFDLVEVNPVVDLRTGVTSYLAAHLIIEFLGMITGQPAWQAGR